MLRWFIFFLAIFPHSMRGQDLGALTTQQLLNDISQTLSDNQLAPSGNQFAPPRTTVRPKLKPSSLYTNPCADMEKPIAVGSIQIRQYDDLEVEF